MAVQMYKNPAYYPASFSLYRYTHIPFSPQHRPIIATFAILLYFVISAYSPHNQMIKNSLPYPKIFFYATFPGSSRLH